MTDSYAPTRREELNNLTQISAMQNHSCEIPSCEITTTVAVYFYKVADIIRSYEA